MSATTPARYRQIVAFAAALLALIVFTGAAVRLTRSGLGCSDWPICSKDQPVPEFTYHAWVEFGNRLLSGVVAIGVIAAVLGALRRLPKREDLVTLAWLLVLGVLIQIVLGAVTVKLDLHPAIVASHFLLSMLLMWNVIVLYVRSASGRGPATAIESSLTAHLRLLAGMGVVILLTGTVVTGTGPHSGDSRADRLALDLTSVVRIHSLTVWAFLALLLALAWRVNKTQSSHQLFRSLTPLLAATIAQGAIGYTQYFTGVPALLVLAHIIGATILWCALVWTYLNFFERPAEAYELATATT